MSARVKEDALVIYLKVEKKIENVRAFLEYFDYLVGIKSYKKVTPTEVRDKDLIVFVTPENYKLEPDTLLAEVVNLALNSGTTILTLGDLNSTIVNDLIGYKIDLIDGHFLEENQVHNIVDINDEEYYIPSRHISTLDLQDVNFYESSSSTSKHNLIEVVCASPIQENSKLEVEIFMMKTFNYLGVYGAPELFFSDGEGGSNKISKSILSYIDVLLTELK